MSDRENEQEFIGIQCMQNEDGHEYEPRYSGADQDGKNVYLGEVCIFCGHSISADDLFEIKSLVDAEPDFSLEENGE